jgi:hypothetical protein
MTFSQAEFSEFEEVRQHHDAFVEMGRLELMAEEIRSREAAATRQVVGRMVLDSCATDQDD